MAGIFEGIKILDFTNNVAGPCATANFADLGAEVIKVERPIAGDDSRGIAPRIEGQSLTFMWMNRGKESVVLNLTDPDALEIIYEMVKDVDVVVESFKPGMMKRHKLDYETLSKINPSIIYCSISVGGQTGGYSKMPGFDIIAQGMSGLMDLCGEPDGMPVKNGVTIGDYVAGGNAFGAISAALFHRERTGEGQYIDISLLDGLIACNTTVENAANLGANPTRSGAHHGTMAPYGIYRGTHGQTVIIAAYTNGMWTRLCNALGKPELIDHPDFNTVSLRLKNLPQLIEIIEGWLGQYEDINDAIQIMTEAGVACCKIKSTKEVVNDPVLNERGTFIELPTPPSLKEHKTIKTRGPAVRYSKTPAKASRSQDLGESNYKILERYGWSREKIDELETKWEENAKK